MQTKFVFVIHPKDNGQDESANKVILKGLKEKLEDAKGLWVELLHEILWPYHTTPQSTTRESPISMVYGVDTMLLIEIDTPSWRRTHFNEEANKIGLKYVPYLIDELR